MKTSWSISRGISRFSSPARSTRWPGLCWMIPPSHVTLIYRIQREEEITHPHAVKVVFDQSHFALYFSRATIPFVRDKGQQADYYKHHGIYAYRRSFLTTFTGLPEGILEKLEALEQLRAIEHGYKIKVVETRHDSVEVDTREELERVARMIEGRE